MSRDLFYDKAMQADFDRRGYVVIDLMDDKQFQNLLALYDEIDGVKNTINTNNDNSYELSFFEKDVDIKKKKFAAMQQYFSPLLAHYIIGYQPIIVNLFNKEHGKGEVPIHQNWTFVDENRYTSVSVWCPLQKVNRQNGTLEVVPGSHKVISNYRSPSIPWVFDEISELMIEKYMVPLELLPGQIAIIDDSVIHYSGINHTNEDRKAVQLIMKPADAQLIHCYRAPDRGDEVDILAVNDDFFFDFDMWQKPKSGTLIGKVDFPIHKISESELVERCNKNLMAL